MSHPPISRTVAVIGAGAAGLNAAVELHREGHKVVVFERQPNIGGTWSYTPETEPDPLGLDPTRKIVHTSLYASLRTNLPREVMGFRAYPFAPTRKPGRDSRRFPGHREVLDYLMDYAEEFGVLEMVRFGREVCDVRRVDERWVVRSKSSGGDGGDGGDGEDYEAVVVCNGHYTEPRLAQIEGIEEWPGKQMHSHNYRMPDPFHGQVLCKKSIEILYYVVNVSWFVLSSTFQTVVVIGSSASSEDISRDIARVAKEVHVASRSIQPELIGKLQGHDNIWLHPMIDRVFKDSTVAFQDGDKIRADVILHCTGYKFHFPFLETDDIVTVDDNRVGPLYQHVFPPKLAPFLSFVGLPWKVVPFPLFEFQNKWIAGAISGRISLPSIEEMIAETEAFYLSLEASGVPKRYTHKMGDSQFEYDDWLAAQGGDCPTEEWRKEMYFETGKRKRRTTETYRDQWEDEDLIRLARQDFEKLGFGFNCPM